MQNAICAIDAVSCVRNCVAAATLFAPTKGGYVICRPDRPLLQIPSANFTNCSLVLFYYLYFIIDLPQWPVRQISWPLVNDADNKPSAWVLVTIPSPLLVKWFILRQFILDVQLPLGINSTRPRSSKLFYSHLCDLQVKVLGPFINENPKKKI